MLSPIRCTHYTPWFIQCRDQTVPEVEQSRLHLLASHVYGFNLGSKVGVLLFYRIVALSCPHLVLSLRMLRNG